MATPAKEPEWLILQKRIFTRWLNQKLALRGVKIDNCVTDIRGEVLVELIEVLSEKSFGAKRLEKNPKLRVKQLDNANQALAFMKKCGVETELVTSAENLVDGTEKQVLGLIWAVMRKFMKFGNEDDPKLNARDALLAWVKNQTLGYKGVNVVDFTKSFHSGLALCALIHHFRPKLIPYESLDEKKPLENLKIAMDGAEKYFGMDAYIKPEDIAKLDEKGMIVYVSEYYAGIAAQRKMDIAGRRITKLIKNTQLNDAMRAEYLEKGKQLKQLLDKWSHVLQDRTIDNTLAGSKKRLDEFFEYKTKDKLPIIDFYLSVEALYSHLAMRLADHKRPPFNPPAGWTLKELSDAFLPLEKCEQERNVALHDEYNRQVGLVRLNDQHLAKYNKLKAWIAVKKAYLEANEAIASSGDAQYQLNTLLAYNDESSSVKTHTVKELTDLGAKLIAEKYENSAAVQQREADIKAEFEALDALAGNKLAVLKDAVERETFKEKTVLRNEQHVASHAQLKSWLDERAPYLNTKEAISDVKEAQLALQAIDLYIASAVSQRNAVAPFKALGASITSAHYESKHSQWSFPENAAVTAREAEIDAAWASADALSANKHAVLKDDVAREIFRDRVVLNAQQHAAQYASLKAWIDEKTAFLQKKETVESVRDARFHLDQLGVYRKAKADATAGAVAAFSALGKEILNAKYESKHSTYTFPTPNEIHERETFVGDAWNTLESEAARKQAVLEDDLAREEYKDATLLLNQQHASSYNNLKDWITAKEVYLAKAEEIKSIRDARVALDVLGVYEKAKADLSTDVKAFSALGTEVLDRKYESKLSSYTYDKPEEVKDRVSFVETKWAALDTASAAKKTILEADLAREIKKEELRLAFAGAAAQTLRFVKDSLESLAAASFGTSLAAVEAYGAVLEKEDSDLKTQSSEYLTKYTAAFNDGKALGVVENRYTTSTVDELNKALGDVALAVDARRTAYAAELEKQRQNDALCKKLADVATPFTKQLQANKDLLSNTKEDLEGQLKTVAGYIAAEGKDGAALPAIAAAQEAIDKAGVTHNPHTLLSYRDCTVQWEQYKAFLARKSKQIEEEIQHKKLKGVTPEQYAEIETQFKQFDKDGSGLLDKSEFKACLFSLGYEFDGQTIEKLMKSHSKDDGKHVDRDGFRAFMISTLGDTDTKDEIVAGFKLINKGDEVATPARMNDVLADDMLKYMSEQAPKKGNGYDYVAFTNDMFSR